MIAGDGTGCFYHKNSPLHWRTGNPRSCVTLKNAVKQNHKDGAGYKPKSSGQIQPQELIAVRRRLLSSGKVEDFQLYVIILLAVKLFLRHDDFHTLRVEDIIPDLCNITENGVESIAFKVMGKSERRGKGFKAVVFTLWADHRVTKLCPIRHLLAYANLIGIRGGFLFPTMAEVRRRRHNGLYETFTLYSSFNGRLRSILSEVTGRDKSFFTTHTFKKSAFLFALWGDASDQDISMAARHRSLETSMRYRGDALYQREVARRNIENLDSIIPTWTPIFCKDVQAAVFVNSDCFGKYESFYELHEQF